MSSHPGDPRPQAQKDVALSPGLRGGLMVVGTASDVGKSQLVTGLCRLLARRGVKVAPFKAQNMSNNSFVTQSGHEIGRAQGIQALAAGAEPETAMNPILLKPTGLRGSQVVLNGRPIGHLAALEYHRRKPEFAGAATEALADLRRRYDVVVAEGAGGAAEINLLDRDIVNLSVAVRAGLPAVVVGDIDRGGVFAALYGTVELLPAELRATVAGFIINKLRGDPAFLVGAGADLERRCGVPTLGVIPWLDDIALDAEDSLALSGPRPRPAGSGSGSGEGDRLDVAVIRFPALSNFTDFDPLGLEPAVGVRMVDHPGALGAPDLIVLPGTKATVADLAWLRSSDLATAVMRAQAAGSLVLGICGGYQMLGRVIQDDVESGQGRVEGLGLLSVETVFEEEKVTRRRRGATCVWPRPEGPAGAEGASRAGAASGAGTSGAGGASGAGIAVSGYQIHHGRCRIVPGPEAGEAWFRLADGWGQEDEGVVCPDGTVLGTSLHGLFEADAFRAAFLDYVAGRRGRGVPESTVIFAEARVAQWDRLADAIEEHLDLGALDKIIRLGAPAPPAP
ncbi:MAG: cobyric acid synthase [Acidimicrobiales bacterium]